jgi:beta-lactamase regulating signal transducer with metallopeptidase domain
VPAVLFLAVVGAGGVVGVLALYRQALASRRLALRLRGLRLPTPPKLQQAAEKSRVWSRARFIDSEEAFSFAYGALRPRVAVSRGLVEHATPAELEAVLVHERYHVRNRDPLKVVLARSLARALFFLPILRGLESRYLAGRELAADRRALRYCGRSALASALLKVVRGPQWPELSTAAAIGGPELLDVRVAQLETGTEPPLSGLTRWRIALSVGGALVLLVSFVAAILGLGGVAAISHTMGMDQGIGGGLDPLGVLICVAPWVLAGWLGWRWLQTRP